VKPTRRLELLTPSLRENGEGEGEAVQSLESFIGQDSRDCREPLRTAKP